MLNTATTLHQIGIDLSSAEPLHLAAAIDAADVVIARRAIDALAQELSALIRPQRLADGSRVERMVSILISIKRADSFASRVGILSDSCFYYSRIGKNQEGIAIGQALLAEAEQRGDRAAQRRLHNVLGCNYADIADFPEAMTHIEIALSLARGMNDPFLEAACLANATSVMKQMGHYRNAIRAAEPILRLAIETPQVQHLRFQCACNGLFSAYRLGDRDAALRFLDVGLAAKGSSAIDPVTRATFENYRALFLIDNDEASTAETLIAEATFTLAASENPRVAVLLAIPTALCDWASGDTTRMAKGRESLRALHERTRVSRLNHDDVLRALIKTYSEPADFEEAQIGMAYSRELVEFVTGVKRAKFYRQIKQREASVRTKEATSEEPFDDMHRWLETNWGGSDPEPPEGKKPDVARHEELSAIHDDLAHLRKATLKKEIRTVAFDTAENWALAAEFFDDQTGQHCFRVGHLAGMLAREIGKDETYCMQIEHAARLHDIGKIAVNETILMKPGRLDDAEMGAMRLHCEVGAHMLAGADDEVLQMAGSIAWHHHEWWNGEGYPKRLSGRTIPLAARICTYADVYDALTNVRPYKDAWPHQKAVDEILKLRGVQFDPDLMQPFLKVLERYVGALAARDIPGFADMDANALIVTRKKLMETISAGQF